MQKQLICALALVTLSITTTFAQNWPQWRGPSLNGVSSEQNLPARWTTDENIAWKLALPGWSGSLAGDLGWPDFHPHCSASVLHRKTVIDYTA